MRRSEAEDLARVWIAGEGKVFRYSRPLVPDEYVVFTREGTVYKCDHNASTYRLKDENREEFIKLLINEELVYVRDFTWGVDTRKMKTNDCNCGAWILKDNDSFHDEKCPRYRKR